MSVVRVSERFQEREAQDKGDGFSDYVRSFQVETDNPNDGPITVLNTPGIPKRMQSYISGNDSNPYARCESVEATPVDGARILWIVRASYTTRFSVSGGVDPNPLNRPPVIRWGATFLTKPAVKGYLVTSGTPAASQTGIVNSAQDPFDPPAEMEDARPTLHVTKNFATHDPIASFDYINSVNSDPWLGGTERQWKCQNISAQNQVENVNGQPFLYWQREYEFHYRQETWDLVLLDQGFTYISGGVRITVKDSADQPKSEPSNLNGSGGLVAVGTAPSFRTYRTYREKSFLQIGLT